MSELIFPWDRAGAARDHQDRRGQPLPLQPTRLEPYLDFLDDLPRSERELRRITVFPEPFSLARDRS